MEKQITKDNSRWTHVQTFLFEFSSDEGCFSAAFRGIVPEQEICRMLAAVRAQVYSRCAEAIHSYLDTHHLEYSDFTACRARLDHHAVMKAGESLLHGNACEILDRRTGRVDAYYGIMDYQHQAGSRCCEGCYYAIAKMPSVQNGTYEYHTICQTFNYNECTSREQSHFSIRKGDGRHMDTLDDVDGYPVLATFGCVDMLRLLAHIQSVTTKEQAAELANK